MYLAVDTLFFSLLCPCSVSVIDDRSLCSRLDLSLVALFLLFWIFDFRVNLLAYRKGVRKQTGRGAESRDREPRSKEVDKNQQQEES